MKDLQQRSERRERKAKELKEKSAAQAEQHAALLERYEAFQEEVSVYDELDYKPQGLGETRLELEQFWHFWTSA